MRRTFSVEGMSCDHCVNRVKRELEKMAGVVSADVSLQPPVAIVEFNAPFDTVKMQNALQNAGPYKLRDADLKDEQIQQSGDAQV